MHAEHGSYRLVDEDPATANGGLLVRNYNEDGPLLQNEEKESEPTSDSGAIPVVTGRTRTSPPSSPTPAVTESEADIQGAQAAPDTPSEVRAAAITLIHYLQRNQWQGFQQHRADLDSGLRLHNELCMPPPEYTEN